jgi:hypothetical protein
MECERGATIKLDSTPMKSKASVPSDIDVSLRPESKSLRFHGAFSRVRPTPNAEADPDPDPNQAQPRSPSRCRPFTTCSPC